MPNSLLLRRVVVGIDFSQTSIAAARWVARWLAKDGEVVLVHALVVPEVHGFLAVRYPVPESLLVNARDGANRRLRELSSSLGCDHVLLEIKEGRPRDVLAQVARDHDAQLIVVGRHGDGGPMRGYPGRTADGLVRSSPVPVLLAAGMMEEAPRRLIVPLTFSSITPYVVEWVKRLSDRFDPEIVVVHVIGPAVLSHVLSMSAVAQGKASMTKPEINRVFGDERDHWTTTLVSAGVSAARIRSEVVFGEVPQEVRDAVSRHSADMIVMGSHAGAIRRALLGSAAGAVLRDAEVPVLVVVEPEESGATGNPA